MALNGTLPAADGSDTIMVQAEGTAEANVNIAVRGYAIEQGAYYQNLQAENNVVGEFSGNH